MQKREVIAVVKDGERWAEFELMGKTVDRRGGPSFSRCL